MVKGDRLEECEMMVSVQWLLSVMLTRSALIMISRPLYAVAKRASRHRWGNYAVVITKTIPGVEKPTVPVDSSRYYRSAPNGFFVGVLRTVFAGVLAAHLSAHAALSEPLEAGEYFVLKIESGQNVVALLKRIDPNAGVLELGVCLSCYLNCFVF